MIPILTVEAMRQSDAATISAGTPGSILMSRAGQGILQQMEAHKLLHPPVYCICGKGNNGGDGFVVAALCARRQIPCAILLQEESFTLDSRYWYDEALAAGVPVKLWKDVSSLRDAGTVVDCIFGTGFRGAARGECARMIELINDSSANVVSADINSGLNGDNGLSETGAAVVHSKLTVSIGSYKPGHFLNSAMDVMMDKTNIDIGIKPMDTHLQLFEPRDLKKMLTVRPHNSNKGTWGTTALVGGSLPYSGAIRLANLAADGLCKAFSAEQKPSASAASAPLTQGNTSQLVDLAACAMRSGVGICRVCAPKSLAPAILPAILESTFLPLSDRDGSLLFNEEEAQAICAGTRSLAFGMGVGRSREAQKLLLWLLTHDTGKLVIDADGLNSLCDLASDFGCTVQEVLQKTTAQLVLTPHPGEFARLTGLSIPEVLQSPISLAESFAAQSGATVLLKGASTIVTDGTNSYLVDRGCAGMATAGSGDVLSGILAALAAWSDAALPLTAAAAACLNGLAGEQAREKYGDIAMIAGDTARCVGEVIAAFAS